MAGAFAATAAGQAIGGRGGDGSGGGSSPSAAGGMAVVAVGAVALTGWGAPGAGVAPALAGLWLAYLGHGMTAPALGAAFHDRVPSASRAASLSARSLTTHAGGVVATLVLGALAARSGLPATWTCVAALATVVSLATAGWSAAAAHRAIASGPPVRSEP